MNIQKDLGAPTVLPRALLLLILDRELPPSLQNFLETQAHAALGWTPFTSHRVGPEGNGRRMGHTPCSQRPGLWFSMEGLGLPRDTWQHLETFLAVTLEDGGATGFECVELGDAATHPTVNAQGGPTTRMIWPRCHERQGRCGDLLQQTSRSCS